MCSSFNFYLFAPLIPRLPFYFPWNRSHESTIKKHSQVNSCHLHQLQCPKNAKKHFYVTWGGVRLVHGYALASLHYCGKWSKGKFRFGEVGEKVRRGFYGARGGQGGHFWGQVGWVPGTRGWTRSYARSKPPSKRIQVYKTKSEAHTKVNRDLSQFESFHFQGSPLFLFTLILGCPSF